MRVLIVDDEPLSRAALAAVLAKRDDITEYRAANDAAAALEELERQPYDVMLLDIQMPEMSGLELIERASEQIKPLPAVVFITAYEEHALAAFEKHALDYILKPFAPDRVNEALDIAVTRSAQERAAHLLDMLATASPGKQRGRIAIKVSGRILFVDPTELLTAEAKGNYVLLQKMAGSHLLRETISIVEGKLAPYGFVRIHRSVLVNSAFVESVELARGEHIVRMKNGNEYAVARTYKGNLRDLAKAWIGFSA
jgi:two-component system, LytTR family, response regulator